MSRKTIFQLVEENYDIQIEIRKINSLFENEYYFESGFVYYSLKNLVQSYLFSNWKYRGTCVTVDEYLDRVYACIHHVNRDNHYEEIQIINNLEVMENFVKLYSDNSDELCEKYDIKYYDNFETIFCELINTLEKKMGLTTREYKDRIVVYPQNAPLEKVVSLLDDEDVQWELISYVRENLSLSEKRKSLAFLATNLYIEEDSKEQEEPIKSIVKKANNVLNNLHIRHNNKTGKWENKALEDVDEKDALTLCDMVYNEMLTIVLLREHNKYESTYKEFNRKQKDAKMKKKAEDT